jgi:hypothetical protein
MGYHPVAVVEYTFTHKNNTQNDTKQKYTEQHNFWKSAGRALFLQVIPWHLPYDWG